MIKIKFGRKAFKFLSSFAEFDLEVVKKYMNAYSKYDESIKELKDKGLLVDGLDDSKDDFLERIIELQSLSDEIVMQIHSSKIEILQSVCTDESFTYFATNTVGVDYELIHEALTFVLGKLGHFDTFWDECPPVNTFAHKPKKKLFKRNYSMHSMDNNTLARTEMASNQLKMAFQYKNELDAGDWNNICEFCAVITRPLLQKEEIAKKGAFIKTKELKGLSHADRLSYYLQKLQESQKKMTKEYSNLSLPVAIGLIKEFWKKKMKSTATMTASTSQSPK